MNSNAEFASSMDAELIFAPEAESCKMVGSVELTFYFYSIIISICRNYTKLFYVILSGYMLC